MTSLELLSKFNPCEEAKEWLENKTPQEAWETCKQPRWLLWAATRLNPKLKDSFVRLSKLFAEDAKKSAAIAAYDADDAAYAADAAAYADTAAAYAAYAAYAADAAAYAAADAAYAAADAYAAAIVATYAKQRKTKLSEYCDWIRKEIPLSSLIGELE